MAKIIGRIAAALLLCLVLAPGAALASSFEFAGNQDDKGVHLHSQGRVNFDWAAITGSDPSGDSVSNYLWGANDVRVFDAIGLAFGTYTLKAGDLFTGLNYTTSMWLDQTNLPNILAGDQDSSYTGWNFMGTLHITSISFPSDYQMILSGSVTDMINRVAGSAVLTDLAAAGTANFSITIAANDRSLSGGLLAALNSTNNSSWANYAGVVGGSMTPVIPEPGTLAMMASALSLGGGMFWRRRRATTPAPAQAA